MSLEEPSAGAKAAAPEPAGPTLPEAERAFEAGDWRTAGRIARRELDSPDGLRRAAAEEMLARFRPDPQLVALYIGCVVLFVIAVVHWVVH